MIILIGGASCTGKTTMAQRLLEKYHYPYLSIDHVKMGIIRSNPNCGFTALDPEDKVTAYVWPIIKEMIKTAIENDQNLIIEGCYIPTEELSHFEEEYKQFIIPFYIGFSMRYIEDHFEDGILKHLSETEHKDRNDYSTKEQLKWSNNLQKERCLRDQQVYFEIDSNYEDDLTSAYQFVDQEILRRTNLKFN